MGWADAVAWCYSQSLGHVLYGEEACLTACQEGFQCLWQSAFLGACSAGGGNPAWLWDDASLHIRERASPDLCLTMCPSQVRRCAAARLLVCGAAPCADRMGAGSMGRS